MNLQSKINRTVQIDQIPGGLIVPHRSDADYQTGGVFRSNGQFVEASKYIGDWMVRGGDRAVEEPIDRTYADQDVMFLGFFIRQWGHYLVDCLGRMWPLVHEKNMKVAMITRHEEISGNYLQVLQTLGVDAERLIIVDRPMQFRNVFLPSLGKDKDWNLAPEYLEMLRYIGKKADRTLNVPKRVYLSRSRIPGIEKTERGENVLEHQFVTNGYAVRYPEQLSFYDQVSLFRHADEIVCVNGTIPLNCMFGSPSLHLVVLNKSSLYHENLEMAAAVAGIQPDLVNVYYEPISGHPRYLGEGPFWMTMTDDFRQYCAARGLTLDQTVHSDANRIWYRSVYLKNRLYAFGAKIYRALKQKG
ncbi:MAG: glycosyltransferase 61 family protein [Catenisphaera adipataccumulans]|jgi:hypothetical protein|uniref:glycosyltransferase 61 family protein n=1 Tax=Catenisphaera adipataccumulans TaxID=700500 RepID=UPI003D8E23E3